MKREPKARLELFGLISEVSLNDRLPDIFRPSIIMTKMVYITFFVRTAGRFLLL